MIAQLRDPCELSKKPLEAEAGRGDGDSDGVDRSLAKEYRARPGDNCGRCCCCCCCCEDVQDEVSIRWWRGFGVDLGPTGRHTLVHRSAGRHSATVLLVSDNGASVSWSVPGAAGRLCLWRFFGGRSELINAGHDGRHKTQHALWQCSCPSSPGLSPLDRRREVSHPAVQPPSWRSATSQHHAANQVKQIYFASDKISCCCFSEKKEEKCRVQRITMSGSSRLMIKKGRLKRSDRLQWRNQALKSGWA